MVDRAESENTAHRAGCILGDWEGRHSDVRTPQSGHSNRKSQERPANPVYVVSVNSQKGSTEYTNNFGLRNSRFAVLALITRVKP